MSEKQEEQFERIDAIVGPDAHEHFDQAMGKFVEYLKEKLILPCEVTGIEDFQWEEPYVFGGWSEEEYAKLKKKQPSYKDRYELVGFTPKGVSKWMMVSGLDIAAHVKRIGDGKEFVLGLSELEPTDGKSSNVQILNDYAVFFWNYR